MATAELPAVGICIPAKCLRMPEQSRGALRAPVLRQKENAPKGMDASKMSAPKVTQNMAGMQAYLGMQEWMQRPVAAGGVGGVGA